MRPLGNYLIRISIYILHIIHFLMIFANFGVFSLMVTDGRTNGHTDGRMDRPSYRDARAHLKMLNKIGIPCYYLLDYIKLAGYLVTG